MTSGNEKLAEFQLMPLNCLLSFINSPKPKRNSMYVKSSILFLEGLEPANVDSYWINDLEIYIENVN